MELRNEEALISLERIRPSSIPNGLLQWWAAREKSTTITTYKPLNQKSSNLTEGAISSNVTVTFTRATLLFQMLSMYL